MYPRRTLRTPRGAETSGFSLRITRRRPHRYDLPYSNRAAQVTQVTQGPVEAKGEAVPALRQWTLLNPSVVRYKTDEEDERGFYFNFEMAFLAVFKC